MSLATFFIFTLIGFASGVTFTICMLSEFLESHKGHSGYQPKRPKHDIKPIPPGAE